MTRQEYNRILLAWYFAYLQNDRDTFQKIERQLIMMERG